MTDEQVFNEAWWAHQLPPVQELRSIQDQGTRWIAANALILRGYVVDEPIIVWGWSPYYKYKLAGLSVNPADYPPFYPPLPPPPPIPPGPAVAYDSNGPFKGFYQIFHTDVNPSLLGKQVSVDGKVYQLAETGIFGPMGELLAWKLVG